MKQVGRPLEYWSASNLSDNLDSYTPIERGGIQRTDRAVTTCDLPLIPQKGTMQSPVPPYPSTMLAYAATTQISRGPRPYGSTGKGNGHTLWHDEPPPQLSSNPDYICYMIY
jgi:hypothetical protein